MRITFNIPEFTRKERNLHCDELHITPVRVARLVLDDAIAAIKGLLNWFLVGIGAVVCRAILQFFLETGQ